MEQMNEKRCTHCEQWKPLEEFYRSCDSRDGHAHWCKECCKAYGKRRRLIEKRKIFG